MRSCVCVLECWCVGVLRCLRACVCVCVFVVCSVLCYGWLLCCVVDVVLFVVCCPQNERVVVVGLCVCVFVLLRVCMRSGPCVWFLCVGALVCSRRVALLCALRLCVVCCV